MLILVHLNISAANMALFDDYEAQAFALMANHGGRLLERLRSTDGNSELHLLHFVDAKAFNSFHADPARGALQELWLRCGASSSVTEVQRVSRY
jgi:uncharacterized protein (DUF1330 family)